METFLDRLENEKKELDERISKLDSFINSEKFESVNVIQKSLLKVQLVSMKTYSQVLTERLVDLKK